MKNKLKILCIIQLPPPIHGSALMNLLVVESKKLKEEFILDVLATNYVKTTEEIGSTKIFKFILLIKYLIILFFKLVFKKPDLVYFALNIYGPPFYRDVLFVILLKLFRVKIVYHLHAKGANKHYEKNKIIYDFVYRNVFVICLSESLKKDVFFYKGTPFVINNGIPDREISMINANIENVEVPVILYLSNFIKSKGVLDLLEAAKILSLKKLNFKVKLIGQYRGELSKEFFNNYISINKLENYIEILGPKFDNDKEKEFLSSDIFVLPTYNEAFPLVLLEAMKFSLPVISTYEGGIPEIVDDGSTGFLVKQRDIAVLAEKMEILITDKSLRKSMGFKAKLKFDEKFTETVFEKNLVEVLKKIEEV